MKKDQALEVLKTLRLIKDETRHLEESEKQKYRVGLIMQESINELRSIIASLEQLEARGEKVNSARQDNLNKLRLVLKDQLELSLILGVGDGSGAAILVSQLNAKIKPTRGRKKKWEEVLEQQEKGD